MDMDHIHPLFLRENYKNPKKFNNDVAFWRKFFQLVLTVTALLAIMSLVTESISVDEIILTGLGALIITTCVWGVRFYQDLTKEVAIPDSHIGLDNSIYYGDIDEDELEIPEVKHCDVPPALKLLAEKANENNKMAVLPLGPAPSSLVEASGLPKINLDKSDLEVPLKEQNKAEGDGVLLNPEIRNEEDLQREEQNNSK